MTTLTTAPAGAAPAGAVATVESVAAAMRAGTLTSTALTRTLLDRIASSNERLGAYFTVCAETAMAAAAAVDEAFAAGIEHGPLQGVPLAIKDIIATQDAPTTANGITGLKTTFGRVPKNGVVSLADTLDSVGPMARSALDCALLLEAIAGDHPGDPYAADTPVPAHALLVTTGAEAMSGGLRVAIPTGYFFDCEELDDEARAGGVLVAVEVLAAAGARATPVDVPHCEEAKSANNVIGGAEALARHRPDLSTRWLDYGRNTRTNLARGAMFSAADYVQAQPYQRQTDWHLQPVAVR